jgi:hypothetical protein
VRLPYYGELRSLLAKDKMRAVLTGKSVLVVVQGDIEGYGVKTSDVSNVRVLFELEGRSLSFQTAGESK